VPYIYVTHGDSDIILLLVMYYWFKWCEHVFRCPRVAIW